MPNWKKLIVSGSGAELTTLKLTGLSAGTPTTALMLDGSNNVEKRTLGSNAFNSTAFTTNTGTVTNVTVGTGLDVEDGTTTPSITLDLSEFSETTTLNSNTAGDEFIVLDGNAERKIKPTNINLSAFNNDSGFISSADGGNAATLDSLDSTDFYRETSKANGSAAAGWVTVAHSSGGRTHGEVIVSDAESGDHSFIRIDWLRSYNDSVFTVINCGGHQNRITGVRVLEETGDKTYGSKYLQVKVTVTSNYQVRVNSLADVGGYSDHDAQTPTLEDSKTGYNVKGNTLETLDTYAFATEQGIRAGGDIASNGDVIAYASSDKRYKDNLTVISNATDKVAQLNGYEFDWNENQSTFSGHDIGVVAQEVEAVLPEIVTTRDNGYKAVKYEKIVALLIESNKELLKRVEELEKKL